MLDMFKRPDDPPEYYHYYGIPAATTLGLYTIGSATGKFPELDASVSTLSGLLCIGGIGGLVTYFILFNEKLNLPLWVTILYIPLVFLTLVALSCVSCRDPGLLERVTDEEAGHGGWFWNEQVGSFRPTGALYCRECKVRLSNI